MAQLDEAVRSYAAEDPGSSIIVVVDATFEHRVSESERETVREAMLDGDMVSPPAGAIGRGDAFVLRIAERTNAVVLSNDSFQEFHGEHPWLFDEGRLIGGKPVPGVGWIFTPRLPIRGPKSRAATAEARSKKDHDSAAVKAAELARAAKKAAKRSKSAKKATKTSVPLSTSWPLVPATPPPVQPKVDPVFVSAVDEAVEEALHPPGPKATRHEMAATPKVGGKAKKDVGKKPSAGSTPASRKKKQRGATPPPAVNEPLAFINFVAAFAVGSTMEGEVVSFTSHGAMVDVPLPVGGVLHCYIPLTAMGTPAPTKARQVLKKGQVRPFLLAGLDPPRRVAELALPEAVAGAPSDQVSEGGAAAPVGEGPVGNRPIGAKRVVETLSVERPARPRKGVAEASKSTAAKRTRAASEKAAPLEKAATPKKSASMKKASAKATAPDTVESPTKKKAGAKTSSHAKKAAEQTGPAKKAAEHPGPAKKATGRPGAAKKSQPAKTSSPAKRAAGQTGPTKKVAEHPGPSQKATGPSTPAKKATGRAGAAKKSQPSSTAKTAAKKAVRRSTPAKKAAKKAVRNAE